MDKLNEAARLTSEILAAVTSSAAATLLIQKWSDKDIGPNPLACAASLEARSIVFGWGR